MNSSTLSKRQYIFLSMTCSAGLSMAIVPKLLVENNLQDFWIVILAALPINIVVCFFYVKLSNSMDNLSYSKYINKTLGQRLGLLVNILYLFYFIFSTMCVNRFLSNVIHVEITPTLPHWSVILPLVLVAFYAVYHGISSIARTAEILVPIIIVMFSCTLLMLLDKIDPGYLLPVFEHGSTNFLKSVLWFVSYTSFTLVALLEFYPSTHSSYNKKVYPMIIGLSLTCIVDFLICAFALMIAGPRIAPLFHYPGYLLAREASLGSILERSDALIINLWFFAVFLNSAICSYVSYSIALRIFNPKNKKLFIFIFAALIMFLSQMRFLNEIFIANFLNTYWFFISCVFSIVLPAAILFINLKINKSKQKNT